MKKLRNLLLGTVAALSLVASVQATPPTGTWSVNANGFIGTMVVTSVNGAGDVVGTFLGNPMKGFWSETAQRLMIYRAIGGTTASTPPERIQIFTAYKFPTSASFPNGSQRLAGSFEAFRGTGATPIRNVFGWFATQ
jgi:hypothetical protein